MTLSSPSGHVIGADPMMNAFYNFSGLMPDATYNVSIASTFRSATCVGIATTTMVTTLTVAAGVPASELPYKA